MLKLKASDLCERDIVSLPATASVREAAAAMRDRVVGAIAVTDPYQAGRVLGIVTDRDLVVDLLARGRDPANVRVKDLCHRPLASVPWTATVHEAVQVMERQGVRRVLVLGPDKDVCGLVSMDDVLQALAGDLGGIAQAVRGGRAREKGRSSRDEERQASLYLACHDA